MSTAQQNPYAPPSTDEALPPAVRHHPTRLLWPAYAVSFLAAAAYVGWFGGANGMASDQGALPELFTYFPQISVGAALVVLLLAGWLGQRPVLRWLVAAGLALLLLAMLGLVWPALSLSNTVHAVGLQATAQLGEALPRTLLTAYVMSAVSTRGAYLAGVLLQVSPGLARLLGTVGRGFTRPLGLVLGGTICAGAGSLLTLGVHPPARVLQPPTEHDPLDAGPRMGGRRALLTLLVLASFAALASALQRQANLMRGPMLELSPSLSYGVLHGPGVLYLVLPVLAYICSWSPGPLVEGGMALCTVGWLATLSGAGRDTRLGWVLSLGGGAVYTLGHRVLHEVALLPLLRQLLPPERMVAWYAPYPLLWSVTSLPAIDRLARTPLPSTLPLVGLGLIPLALALALRQLQRMHLASRP